MSRKLTESHKKQVAADQKFRCANKPNSNLKGIGNYECPMWKLDGGNFDGSGYEIDHIIDHCISQDDSPENLQALCPSCHRRKTRNSTIDRKRKISHNDNIDNLQASRKLCVLTENKKEETNDNYCEECNKYFARPYTLRRHMESVHSAKETSIAVNSNTVNNNENIQGNIFAGDHNIINNYYLLPFKTYDINDLSIADKVAIFSSKINPIEMIIIKTHLDPDKKQYHNCGITDFYSDCGIIYDGAVWKCWPIRAILNTLIELGHAVCLKIYDQIKDFLLDDEQKRIEKDIDRNKNTLRPRSNCFFDIDVKAKKTMIAYLKAKFYDKLKIVQESIKNNPNKTPNKSKIIL